MLSGVKIVSDSPRAVVVVPASCRRGGRGACEWDTIFTPDNTRYQGELVLVLDRNQGRDQDGELAGSAAEGLATHGLLWS